MLPNFLVIGGAKSGTTSLWNFLTQHPAIFMTTPKEPHFLCADEIRPYCQGPGDYKYGNIDLAEYQDLFKDACDETALGEASNSTLYFPGAIEQIKKHIPQAKLIAVLRQPADRAFSAYMHLRRDGRETVEEFAEALQLEDERIASNWSKIWHYRRAGFYYSQLQPFYETFPKDQLRVYLYDDFRNEPLGTVQDMYRFLGVDSAFKPDLTARANQSGVPKYGWLGAATRKLFERPNPLRSVARKLVKEETRARFTRAIRSRNQVRLTIPPDVRRDLTESFRDDILKLQDLIAKDLSSWLQPR